MASSQTWTPFMIPVISQLDSPSLSFHSSSNSSCSRSSPSSPFPLHPPNTEPSSRYSLHLSGISPQNAKSRVETQTRVVLTLHDQYGHRDSFYHTLRIPPLLLAKDGKNKTTFKKPSTVAHVPPERILYLQASVTCSADPNKALLVCDTCVRRELFRANRKKGGAQTESALQLEKKFLIINCSESLLFEDGQVEFPMRITCYSRHHDEKEGFKVTFQFTNHLGEVIASQTCPPIMITDDHKTAKRSQARPSKKRKNTDDSDSSASYAYGSLKMTAVSQTPAISLISSPNSVSELSLFDLQPMNIPPYHVHPSTPAFDTMNLTQISPSLQESYFQEFVDPRIVKVIPSEGPVTGGIEVTVLGERFHPGCLVIFGGRIATTDFFSETTLTCILPPSAIPGPVLVQLKNYDSVQPGSFIYRKDSDRALLELALQIIGQRATGKLEDVINIAMHIVSQQPLPVPENFYSNQEEYLLKALAVLDSPSPFDVQIDMRTTTGHTLLHFVCYNRLYKLLPLLLRHGASPHVKDRNGFRPLHYAAWRNSSESVEILLCVSNIWARTKTGDTALDLARLAGATDVERLILRKSPSEGNFNRSSSFPTLQVLVNDDDSDSSSSSKSCTQFHDPATSFISHPVSRRASFANQPRIAPITRPHSRTGTSSSPAVSTCLTNTQTDKAEATAAVVDEQVQQRVKDIFNTMWLSLARSSDILRRPGDYIPQAIPAFWSEPPPQYQEVVTRSSFKSHFSKSWLGGKSENLSTQGSVEDDEESVVRAAYLIRQSTKDRMVFFFWLPVLIVSIALLYYTGSFRTTFTIYSPPTTYPET
ncbi:Protein SPT23 [Neolecta irregularis DAH-3]|uniref:Protein SPT23 n=1 Tax=Neolecta irregularis (strain DAH-3) TaxID=1198029 RepID=A0A1U7LQ96_NEOID|nr:Protein SPT23 [Neolecta irregularis DAH-3]|eukprot:OLL24835.1 Protein SPT23 [Neolecta irregularis DAH-3]